MQLLLHAIEGINRTMELKSLLQKCMDSASQVMEAEASSLMLLDEVSGELHVSVPTGPIKEKIKGMSIPRDKGIAGWVLNSKEPYFTNELKESDHFFGELNSEFSTRNIMCVPLIDSQNKAIGVLQVLNKKDGKAFTESEIPVFETLAGHVALSIEKVREVDELKALIRDKEEKLKEVHQGLKSNLAAINALIQLELSTIHDDHARFVLKATGSRIEAIANAHHILYNQDEYETVDLGMFLGRMTGVVAEIFDDENKEIGLSLNLDKVPMPAGTALTVGLIVTEVLVYMYEEAFTYTSEGKLFLSVQKQAGGKVMVSISDDGDGLDTLLDGSSEHSLGSVIIRSLAQKLQATLSQREHEGGGTIFTMLF
jgi:two-component sensor histidine kinase